MALVTWFAIIGYGTCSSLMLIMNKLAVHLLPAPSFVLLLQFFFSWFAVKLCGCCGLIVVDQLEWKKLLAFLPVSLAFLAAVFANIKTLQYANVETFVVFRASTPLTLSVCEWLCLGRELPGLRSAACLVTLLAAAAAYVATDAHFVVVGYIWVGVWYLIFCFDQLYIKHAVDNVQVRGGPTRMQAVSLSQCLSQLLPPQYDAVVCRYLCLIFTRHAPRVVPLPLCLRARAQVDSNWGRVFYTNLWACLIAGCLTAATEPHTLMTFTWTWQSGCALGVSCVLGVAMSYFAFLCRAQVSATHFTVIGNICKVVTVLINICIWDKHASPTGICFLLICLVAAFLYKPSPLRSDADPPNPEQVQLVVEEADDELDEKDSP
jgi:solute carrier family 35 protein